MINHELRGDLDAAGTPRLLVMDLNGKIPGLDGTIRRCDSDDAVFCEVELDSCDGFLVMSEGGGEGTQIPDDPDTIIGTGGEQTVDGTAPRCNVSI